jgi:hypothetical protein
MVTDPQLSYCHRLVDTYKIDRQYHEIENKIRNSINETIT